jgi:membrane-associated protease RseP (regulator of RpoE activity)
VTDTSVRPSEAPTPEPNGDEPVGRVVGFDWKLALLIGGTVALGLLGGVGWFVMIAAIVVMIFLHELGHYLTAKWSGMKVTEFFLFFGPKIWSFKRGETEYGIKCIPLGAYVRIIGMSNIDTDVAPEDEPRTYRQQSYPKRVLVASAGSIMHLLQALVLFFLAFSVVGVSGGDTWAQDIGGPAAPEDAWTVGDVVADSAAETVGLQVGDDIVSIDGDTIATFDDVGTAVKPNAGDTVTIVVLRDGKERVVEATLGENPKEPGSGFLGIAPQPPAMPTYQAPAGKGLKESFEATADVMGLTVTGLAGFFTGGVDDFASDVAQGSDDPAQATTSTGSSQTVSEDDANRPLSIFGIARYGAGVVDDGVGEWLILMAIVNISIGLLNMIPLLPLDGGHVAIATYERIRSIGRRRYMADVSRLLPITYAVVMFMVMLGVSAIYLDIVDPIG